LRRALLLSLGAALCLTPVTAQAQTADPAAKPAAPYNPPRMSDGKPDLSGVWSNSTLTPFMRKAEYKDRLAFTEDEVKKLEGAVVVEIEEGNAPTDPNAPAEFRNPTTAERPEFTAAGGAVGGYNRGWLDPGNHVMRVKGEPRTSLLITQNGMPPRRKPDAPKPPGALGGDQGEGSGPLGSFDSYETRSLGERCIIGFGRNGGPPMLPNGFYNNNYHIVQTPEAVMIEVEMNHDARIIRINGKHRTDDVRPYFGDSIGWWEGNTLVVETTHIPKVQHFAGAWENLKITERFERVADDRVYYKFTAEDPTVWDTAWSGEYEFSPLGDRLYEYACHEGNYALPGILAGARVQEEADAKAKPAKGKATKPTR
jgi:hypothetical protein